MKSKIVKKGILFSLIASSYLYGASMEGLGDLEGGIFNSVANSVSSNGLIIVGTSTSINETIGCTISRFIMFLKVAFCSIFSAIGGLKQ